MFEGHPPTIPRCNTKPTVFGIDLEMQPNGTVASAGIQSLRTY